MPYASIEPALMGWLHASNKSTKCVTRRIDQVTRRERQCVNILDEIAMLWYDQLAAGFIADSTDAADGLIPIVSQSAHQLW